MSSSPNASAPRSRFEARSALNWFRRNTIAALILLLLAFIAIVEIVKPGTVNPVWLSNTLLFAAPLGILAAGQTMVMLTGGIDLSVVSIATGSAFLMTTTALKFGNLSAVAIGLALGLVVGAINGVGVALLGVQPLVMTLGTGLMTQGVIIVYSQKILASRSIVPDFIHSIGSDRLGGFIPLDLFLWLPIAALVVIVLARTGFGRLLYAIGDNPDACRLCRRPRVAAYFHRLRDLRSPRVDRGLRPRRPYQLRRSEPGLYLSPTFDRGGHHWRDLDLWRTRRLFRQHRGRLDSDSAGRPVDPS